MSLDHPSQLVALHEGEADLKDRDKPWSVSSNTDKIGFAPTDKQSLRDRPVIVLVHGINGHFRQSWTLQDSKEGMSIEDPLPSYIPGARIMSFSYTAPQTALSSSWLKQEARILLEELKTIGHNEVLIQESLLDPQQEN
jgi:predicted alpha/beta-fold hydrolase